MLRAMQNAVFWQKAPFFVGLRPWFFLMCAICFVCVASSASDGVWGYFEAGHERAAPLWISSVENGCLFLLDLFVRVGRLGYVNEWNT
jgi:hypothetical protein